MRSYVFSGDISVALFSFSTWVACDFVAIPSAEVKERFVFKSQHTHNLLYIYKTMFFGFTAARSHIVYLYLLELHWKVPMGHFLWHLGFLLVPHLLFQDWGSVPLLQQHHEQSGSGPHPSGLSGSRSADVPLRWARRRPKAHTSYLLPN